MPQLEVTPDSPVHVIHSAVAGRARLHVPGLYRKPAVKAAIEGLLPGREGIRTASASTLTGNVLVILDAGREPGAALQFIEAVVRSLNGHLKETVLPASWRGPEARLWHTMPAEEVIGFWKTSRQHGLDDAAAQQRLRRYGMNRISPARRQSAWRIFLDQFKSLPVLLLLGSAAFSVATGGLADAVVIVVVVLLNASISSYTEMKAEKTIFSLLDFSEPTAPTMRGGAVREIAGEEIVPGDLLLLVRGRQIVADARIIDVDRLTVDESPLTGESMAVEKSGKVLGDARLPIADRLNMVHKGTVVSGGSGMAVVVATGGGTEIGAVQRLIGEATQPETPLQKQLRVLGSQMVMLAGAVCGAVVVVGILRGFPALQMIRSAISLAVAAVPEGLPSVATYGLANGVRTLLRQKVLVRRLDALETLGSVQVMCFDKTGTLTLNEMSVVSIFAGMRRYTVESGSFWMDGQPIQPPVRPAELARLLEVCVLCSEASIGGHPGAWTIEGSATETALVQLAVDAGMDVGALRDRYPLLRTRHRAARQNYMTTSHQTAEGRRLVAVKGRPSEVLVKCTQYRKNARVLPLTPDARETIERENERMAQDALRVLGFAASELNGKSADDTRPLVWLGLVGIANPPRRGLRSLIGGFRDAGVKPVILTGDQAATARALARPLKLNGEGRLQVLDARHMEGLDAEELAARIPHTSVFSRVSPSHKLQIVQALQAEGKVVAMTGDGINDGPALKAADIGIVLGRSGARVAREVADILLTDDTIQAMIPAIREGRRVHDGIRKATHYIAATNLSEILVVFFSLASGLGQPFSTRQLLWVNLISDVFPELALVGEPADGDLLQSPPRDPQSPIVGTGDYHRIGIPGAIMAASGLASYVAGMSGGGKRQHASTMSFMTLLSAQLLHALSLRNERSAIWESAAHLPGRPVAGAVGAGFVLLALSQLFPGLRSLLGVAPLGLAEGILSTAFGMAGFLAHEATKYLGRKEMCREESEP